LFNSARLPFSDAQKKAVLSWAKELGARDIPSLRTIKQSNERICKLVGNPMCKVTSASGNIFYINDIGHAIAKVNYMQCVYHPMLTVPLGLCKPTHPLCNAGLSRGQRRWNVTGLSWGEDAA